MKSRFVGGSLDGQTREVSGAAEFVVPLIKPQSMTAGRVLEFYKRSLWVENGQHVGFVYTYDRTERR